MFTYIENLKIHYKWQSDQKEERLTLVLLHGWGQDSSCFSPIMDRLSKYRCLLVDLPGFGLSQIPLNILNFFDYARIIKKLLEKLEVVDCVVLGHSFGGKIACGLACIFAVKKLILVGSAGIILPKRLGVKIRIFLFHLLKPLRYLLPKNWLPKGSADYQRTKGIMREILVNSVNESLKELLPKLKLPVLLIWGQQDTVTPTADNFYRLLPQAQLEILPGDHFVFLHSADLFCSKLNNFLRDSC